MSQPTKSSSNAGLAKPVLQHQNSDMEAYVFLPPLSALFPDCPVFHDRFSDVLHSDDDWGAAADDAEEGGGWDDDGPAEPAKKGANEKFDAIVRVLLLLLPFCSLQAVHC